MTADGSESWVEHEHGAQVDDVEEDHADHRPLEGDPTSGLTRRPKRDHHVRDQHRDQEQLLHELLARSEARTHGPRNAKASARRRVLFVTPYLPSPPRFGGQQRMHALMSGLARAHDVCLLSFVNGTPDLASLQATRAYCERVVTVPNRWQLAGGRRKRLLQLASTLTPWSHAYLVHRSRAMQAALDAWLVRERFDVVQLEFAQMAACQVRGDEGPIVCLDAHNVEYDIIRRTARGPGALARRAFSELEWRKLRSEEHRGWEDVDGCAVTSTRDLRFVHSNAPRTPAAVVANGVDLDFFRPRPGEDDDAHGAPAIVFFGAIDYFPNTDGVLFFAHEVWPRLVAKRPNLRWLIVGRHPPEAVRALASWPGVEVTGGVDDVRPYIALATAIVVPLRIGGGTRLKILEAMAMGKAVVSTALGAEGIDARDGHDLLLADTPEELAARTEEVMGDAGLRASLGAHARSLVEARYGWHASVNRLSDFHAELIERRAMS